VPLGPLPGCVYRRLAKFRREFGKGCCELP
jgi:hypothetical protein